MLNFTANALKFTHTGSVTLRCRTLQDDVHLSMFRFEVQDTGIGVSPADQARIFEPFEQADDTINHKRASSGLGLAINRLLVRAMGGDFRLESSSGGGSLFWFTARLPPAPAAAEAAELDNNADHEDLIQRLSVSLASSSRLIPDLRGALSVATPAEQAWCWAGGDAASPCRTARHRCPCAARPRVRSRDRRHASSMTERSRGNPAPTRQWSSLRP